MSDITYPNKNTGDQFTAADANEIKTAVNTKVDKVTGKELSTNDYTTEDKNKVANVPADTTAELANKVDKSGTKQLSDENYTSAEKSKLAGLANYFKGTYATLAALNAAIPTGQPGWEAIVDEAGSIAQKYIWDDTDATWVLSSGIASATFAELGGSPADNAALAAALAAKVDKVTGKGLSTNDFDATAKSKVDNTPADTNAALAAKDDKIITIDNLDANFTPTAADLRKWKRFTGSVTRTITLPSDTDLSVSIGFNFTFSQAGTGTVQWAAGSGATVNSADTSTKLRGQFSAGQAVKVAANTWLVIGDTTV